MERRICSSCHRDDPSGSDFSSQFAAIANAAAGLASRYGVTGFLLCTPWWFAQVLEGETDLLDQLMGGLLRHSRNWDIRVLARVNIKERLFSGWAMDWQHHTIANRIVFLETGLSHDLPPGIGEAKAVLDTALRLAGVCQQDNEGFRHPASRVTTNNGATLE